MNCLTDFIGLQGCGNVTPISGLYINDYPGMSSELLEKISSPEQASYYGFWESAQRVAYTRLKKDIQAALYKSAQARLDQVLFQTSRQFVQDWQQIQILEPAEQFRGVFVSVNGSKYIGINIRQVYIYNAGDEAVEDVPVKIFQTQDGKLLWEDTVTVQVGMNFIPVNEIFYSDFDKVNVMVAVDCTNLITTKGDFVDFGWNQMDVECATRFTYLWRNGWTIFPVTAPLNYGLGQSWSQSTSQTGVYMDATLICSLDAFICGQRDFITDAWANILCHQILWSKMASPRANYFAQGNREFTERSMVSFESAYKESLDIWAQQLNLSDEGLCFDCSAAGLVQQGFTRP